MITASNQTFVPHITRLTSQELVKAKDALGAEWEARMTDTVARHAQQMAAAAASYEARLEDGRRELAAVQVPAAHTQIQLVESPPLTAGQQRKARFAGTVCRCKQQNFPGCLPVRGVWTRVDFLQ